MNDQRLGLGLVVVGIGWIVAVETVFPLLFARPSSDLAWLTFVSSLNGYGVGIVYVVVGATVLGASIVDTSTRGPRGGPLPFRYAIGIVGLVVGLFVGSTLVREYLWWHTVTGFVPLAGLGSVPPYQLFVGSFARPAELAAYGVVWLFAFGCARTHTQRLVAVIGFGFVPGSVALNFVLESQLPAIYLYTVWTVPLYALLYGLALALAGYALSLPPADRRARSMVDRALSFR